MGGKNRKSAENLIYYLMWVAVFAVTLIGFNRDGKIAWDMVGKFWLRALPLFVLFLLNNYILIPRLLLRKKYGSYAAWSAAGIVAVLVFYLLIFHNSGPDDFHHRGAGHGPGPGPGREYVMDEGNPAEGESPGEYEYFRQDKPPKDFRRKLPPAPFPVKWGPLIALFFFSLFVVGFNVAIRLIFKTIDDARVMEQLERQNLRAELDYLRAQVNPHFFMNTLNNIHALVDIDTEKAKETIIELSKIMRYILYETDKTFVPLKSEVKFIRNYVSLMRIRFTGNISIETRYPDTVPEAIIPPLVLITLVENAFKHGVSYRKESYIKTDLEIGDGRVVYTVSNSMPEKAAAEKGMGLENMRKRLTLLYGGNFSLDISQDDTQYTAVLDIPLEP